LISIKGLVNIISWIIGVILCLAGHILKNNECIFRFYNKQIMVIISPLRLFWCLDDEGSSGDLLLRFPEANGND